MEILILSKKIKILKILKNFSTLEIEKYPLKIEKLLHKSNINLLKQEYNFKSEIKLDKYLIDTNSGTYLKESKSLRLTGSIC